MTTKNNNLGLNAAKRLLPVLALAIVFLLAFSLAFTAENNGVLSEMGLNTAETEVQVTDAWDGKDKTIATASGNAVVNSVFGAQAGTQSVSFQPTTAGTQWKYNATTSMSDTTITPSQNQIGISSGIHSNSDWFVVEYFFAISATDNPQLFGLINNSLVSLNATASFSYSKHSEGAYLSTVSATTYSDVRDGGAINSGYDVSSGNSSSSTLSAADLHNAISGSALYLRWTFYGYHTGTVTSFGSGTISNLTMTFTMAAETAKPTVTAAAATTSWQSGASGKNINFTASDAGVVKSMFYTTSSSASAPASDSSYTQVATDVLVTNNQYQKFTNTYVFEVPNVSNHYFHFRAYDLQGNVTTITKTLYDFYIDPYSLGLAVTVITQDKSDTDVGYINRTITLGTDDSTVILPWTDSPVTMTFAYIVTSPYGLSNLHSGGSNITFVNAAGTAYPSTNTIEGTVNTGSIKTQQVRVKSGTSVESDTQTIRFRFDLSTPNVIPAGAMTATYSDGTDTFAVSASTWYNYSSATVKSTATTAAATSGGTAPSGIKLQYRVGATGTWVDATMPTVSSGSTYTSDGGWYAGSGIDVTKFVSIAANGANGMLITDVYVRAYNRFGVYSSATYSFHVCLDTVAPNLLSITHSAIGTAGVATALTNPTVTTVEDTASDYYGWEIRTYSATNVKWTFDNVAVVVNYSDAYNSEGAVIATNPSTDFGPAATNFSGISKTGGLMICNNYTGVSSSTFSGDGLTPTYTYENGNYYQSGSYTLTATEENSGTKTWAFCIQDVAGNGYFVVFTTKIDNVTPGFSQAVTKGSSAVAYGGEWYNDYITITLTSSNAPLSGVAWYYWGTTSSAAAKPSNNSYTTVSTATNTTFGTTAFTSVTPGTGTGGVATLTIVYPNTDSASYFYFQIRSAAYSGTTAVNLGNCYYDTNIKVSIQIDGTAPAVSAISGRETTNNILAIGTASPVWTTGRYNTFTVSAAETAAGGSGLAAFQGGVYYKDGSGEYSALSGSNYSSFFNVDLTSSDSSHYGVVTPASAYAYSNLTLDVQSHSTEELYVGIRVKDIAGNWSTYFYARLYVDNITPVFSMSTTLDSSYWGSTSGGVTPMTSWTNNGFNITLGATSTEVSALTFQYQIGSSSASGYTNLTTTKVGDHSTVTLTLNPSNTASFINAAHGSYSTNYFYNAQYIQATIYFRCVNQTGLYSTKGLGVRVDQKNPEITATLLNNANGTLSVLENANTWLGAYDIKVLIGLKDGQSGLALDNLEVKFYYVANSSLVDVVIRNNNNWATFTWDDGTAIGGSSPLYTSYDSAITGFTYNEELTYYMLTLPKSAFGDTSVRKYPSGSNTFYVFCSDNASNAIGDTYGEAGSTYVTMKVDSYDPTLGVSYANTGDPGKGVYPTYIGISDLSANTLNSYYTYEQVLFTFTHTPTEASQASGILGWQVSTKTFTNFINSSGWSGWTNFTPASTDTDNVGGKLVTTVTYSPTDNVISGVYSDILGVAYRFRVITNANVADVEYASGGTEKVWVVCFDPYRDVTYYYSELSYTTSAVYDNEAHTTVNFGNLVTVTPGATNIKDSVVIDSVTYYPVGANVDITVNLSLIPKGYYFAGIFQDDGSNGTTNQVISTTMDASDNAIFYYNTGVYSSGSSSYTVNYTVTNQRNASTGKHNAFRVVINAIPVVEYIEVRSNDEYEYSLPNLDSSYNAGTIFTSQDADSISQLVKIYSAYQTASGSDLTNAYKNFASTITQSFGNLIVYSAEYRFAGASEPAQWGASTTHTTGSIPSTIGETYGKNDITGYFWIRLRIYMCLATASGYQYVEVSSSTYYDVQMFVTPTVIETGNLVVQISYGQPLPTNLILSNPTFPYYWETTTGSSATGGLGYAFGNGSGTSYTVPQYYNSAPTSTFYTVEDSTYTYYGGTLALEDSAEFNVTQWNAGNYYSVGIYQLKVKFYSWTNYNNPSAGNVATGVTKYVTLIIAKATPTEKVGYEVASAAVEYGQVLTNNLFNVQANLAASGEDSFLFVNANITDSGISNEVYGTLTWHADSSYRSPTDTITTRYVVFTPTDTTNYNVVGENKDFTIQVDLKSMNPTVGYVASMTLTYGQSVEEAILSTSDGANVKKITDSGLTNSSYTSVGDYFISNANKNSAVEAGAFTWASESAGTRPEAGTRTAYVNFQVTSLAYASAYNTIKIPVTIIVAKANISLVGTNLIPIKKSWYQAAGTYDVCLDYGSSLLDVTSSWQNYFGFTATNAVYASYTQTYQADGNYATDHNGLKAAGWSFATNARLNAGLYSGDANYELTFIPADTNNYNTKTFTLRIRVDKAVPEVTVEKLSNLTYGQHWSYLVENTTNPDLSTLKLSLLNPNSGATLTKSTASNWKSASNENVPTVANILDARSIIEQAHIGYGVVYTAAALEALLYANGWSLKTGTNPSAQAVLLNYLAYSVVPTDTANVATISNTTSNETSKENYYLFLDLQINQATPYFVSSSYASSIKATAIYFGQSLSYSSLSSTANAAYNTATYSGSGSATYEGVWSWADSTVVPTSASYDINGNQNMTAYNVVWKPVDSKTELNPARWNFRTYSMDANGNALRKALLVNRAEAYVTISGNDNITYGRTIDLVKLNLTAYRLIRLLTATSGTSAYTADYVTLTTRSYDSDCNIVMRQSNGTYVRWFYADDESNPLGNGTTGTSNGAYYGTTADANLYYVDKDTEVEGIAYTFTAKYTTEFPEGVSNFSAATERPDVSSDATYKVEFGYSSDNSTISYNVPQYVVETVAVQKATLTVNSISASAITYGQPLSASTISISFSNTGNWFQDPVSSNSSSYTIEWITPDAVPTYANGALSESFIKFGYRLTIKDVSGTSIKAGNYNILTGNSLEDSTGYVYNVNYSTSVVVNKAKVSVSDIAHTIDYGTFGFTQVQLDKISVVVLANRNVARFGMPLSALTLSATVANATAGATVTSAIGTLAWTDPSIRIGAVGNTAGNYSFKWTPTGSDSSNYEAATVTTYVFAVVNAETWVTYSGSIAKEYGTSVDSNWLTAANFTFANAYNAAQTFIATSAIWTDTENMGIANLVVGTTASYKVTLTMSAANAANYALVDIGDGAHAQIGITITPYNLEKDANNNSRNVGFSAQGISIPHDTLVSTYLASNPMTATITGVGTTTLVIGSDGNLEFYSKAGYANLPTSTTFDGRYAGTYTVKFVSTNPNYSDCTGYVTVGLSGGTTPTVSYLNGATNVPLTFGLLLSNFGAGTYAWTEYLSVTGGYDGIFSFATVDDGTMTGNVLTGATVAKNFGSYDYWVYWTPAQEIAGSVARTKYKVTFLFSKATPTVTIPSSAYTHEGGALLTYGQTLAGIYANDTAIRNIFSNAAISILNPVNATLVSEIPGTFQWVYTAMPVVHRENGTVTANTYTNWLKFVPTDLSNYNEVFVPILATVNPATSTDLVISAACDTSLSYGQLLSSITSFTTSFVNNYSNLAAGYNTAWKTPSTQPEANTTYAGVAMAAKTTTYVVVMTPIDTNNYSTFEYNITVVVRQAAATIENIGLAEGKNGLKYGMTLAQAMNDYSVLAFSDAMTAVNNNISAGSKTVAGTFSWVFDAENYRPSATSGSENLYFKFTPTDADNYVVVTGGTGGSAFSNYVISVAINKVDIIADGEIVNAKTHESNTYLSVANTAFKSAITGYSYMIYGEPFSNARPTTYVATNPYSNAAVTGTFAWVGESTSGYFNVVGAAGATSGSITFTPIAAQSYYYNNVTYTQQWPEVRICSDYVYTVATRTVTYGQFVNSTNAPFTGITATNKYNNTLSVDGTFAWNNPTTVYAAGIYGGTGNPALPFTFTPVAEVNASYAAGTGNPSGGTVSITVTVNKATATFGDILTNGITYGMSLTRSTFRTSSISVTHTVGATTGVPVSGTFAWNTPSTVPTVADSNSKSFYVTWTPSEGDTALNYNSIATLTATVAVAKANILIVKDNSNLNIHTGTTLKYGQKLSSALLSGTIYNYDLYIESPSTAQSINSHFMSGSTATDSAFRWSAPDTIPNAGSAAQTFAVRIYITRAQAPNYNCIAEGSGSNIAYYFEAYYNADGTPTNATANVLVEKSQVTMPGLASVNVLTYGNVLSAAGLSDVESDGTASGLNGNYEGTGVLSVQGTATYDEPNRIPAATTETGTQYRVVFTPTGADANNYLTTYLTVQVIVNKAKPTVYVSRLSVAAITYGQTLALATISKAAADAVINCNAATTSDIYNVAGAFAWTNSARIPHVSEASTTSFSFTFTPTDTANYLTVSHYYNPDLKRDGDLLQIYATVNPATVVIKPNDSTSIAEGTSLTSFYVTDAVFDANGNITNIDTLLRSLNIVGLVGNDNAATFNYGNFSYTTEKVDASTHTAVGGGSYSTSASSGECYKVTISGITSDPNNTGLGDYTVTYQVGYIYVVKRGTISFEASSVTNGNTVSITLPTDEKFRALYGNVASAAYSVGYYDETGSLITIAASYVDGELYFESVGEYDYFVMVNGSELSELRDYSTLLIVLGCILVAAGAAAIAVLLLKNKKKAATVPALTEEEQAMTKLLDELNLPSDDE